MDFHSTTIVALKHRGEVALAGDGQVTFNNTIMKHGARKIRSLHDGSILAGFAGSAADSFTLFERFEIKLKEHNGILGRAAVELAKDWRTDRALRRLEAMMIVADAEKLFLLSGAGDVIEPDDGVLAIGSGGNFALAAAKGMLEMPGVEDLSAEDLVGKALKIAAAICPFTNGDIIVKKIGEREES